jgi:two-component system response regulator
MLAGTSCKVLGKELSTQEGEAEKLITMTTDDKLILLVEDNPDDQELTLRALKKNNMRNEVVVARDGVTGLDFLFGTVTHAGRDLSVMPQVVLLDLKLPKVDGLEVLP